MNTSFVKFSVLAIVFGMSMAVSPAYSQGKGKGKDHLAEKGKHGRDTGELPFGLEQFSQKKGTLPSGLQKKKDDDGSLTRGLEDGGKPSTSTGKTTKGRK